MWFQEIAAIVQANRKKKAVSERIIRLHLEELGPRIVPTNSVNQWIGPDGGFWSDPANWSAGHTPQPTDMLITGSTSSTDDLSSVTLIDWQNNGSTITIGSGNSVNGQQYILNSASGAFLLLPGSTIASDNYIYNYGFIDAAGSRMMSPTITINSPNVILESGSILTVTGGTPFSPGLNIIGNVSQYGVLNDGSTISLGTLSINGSYVINASGYTTLVPGSSLNYSGSTALDVEGTLEMQGSTLQSSSGVTVNGVLLSDGGSGATDSINGDVTVGGGTFEILGATHTLKLTGNYTQASSGELWVEITGGGGGALPLDISGGATLHGTLKVTAVGDLGTPSQTWYVMQAAGGFGFNFDNYELPSGYDWTETMTTSDLTGEPVYAISN
jgi:hypothetical protein